MTDRMARQAELLARAERLEATRRSCDLAFAGRGSRGSPTWLAWERSASAVRAALDEIYPPSLFASIEEMRSGDPSGLDDAITFLEADPWCLRSGYVKADLIAALTHLRLDDEARERLQAVVLHVADDGRSRRELKWYRRLAQSVMDQGLSAALLERGHRADPAAGQRARYLLGAHSESR